MPPPCLRTFRLFPCRAGSSFGGGTDKAGNPVWPATTHLVALERGEGPFKVEWKAGNMPRKPKLWTEWSAAAYQGAKREPVYDWRKMQKEREDARLGHTALTAYPTHHPNDLIMGMLRHTSHRR